MVDKIDRVELLEILRTALENKVIEFKDLVPIINSYHPNMVCEDVDCLGSIGENEATKCKKCEGIFHDFENCIVLSDDKESSRYCFVCWNASSDEFKQEINTDKK